MPKDDRRREARIRCRLSLGCQGEWTHIEGTVIDIGQSGCRVRLPVDAIGLQEGVGLEQAACQIQDMLTEDVVSHFLPEVLGTLVTRRIAPQWLSFPEDDPDSVEIGVRFDVPLGQTETAALGVPLPGPEGAPADVSSPRVRVPSPRPAAAGDEVWDPTELGR